MHERRRGRRRRGSARRRTSRSAAHPTTRRAPRRPNGTSPAAPWSEPCDVVGRADECLVPRRGAARQVVPQAAGPALDEIEPRRSAGRQLRRGRVERRERRLERRLAAEVLPEHLHRRPARPGGEPAERAERVRLVRAPSARKLATHLLGLRPRPGRNEVRALRTRRACGRRAASRSRSCRRRRRGRPRRDRRGGSCLRRAPCRRR